MAQMDYRQVRQLKEQYKDSLLFVRVGDFYESYGDDAVTLSKELDLTLTGRTFAGRDMAGAAERISMTGVPFHAADNYIKQLVDKGFRVAVAESAEQREKSAESRAAPETDGMMIKSQVEGWPDWSTKDLPGNIRKYAEWLISNGYENESDVKSAFYYRQTSSMSDDRDAEKNDNAAIMRVARKYMMQKDAEQAAAAPAPAQEGNIRACRRIAQEYWGEVQTEETLMNGVYRFDTAGHGGYVADGNAFNLDKIPKQFFSDTNKKIAVFEEDCDWAVLFYCCPAISEEYYRQAAHTHSPKFYEKYPTHDSFFKDCVIGTMESYHKELLPTVANDAVSGPATPATKEYVKEKEIKNIEEDNKMNNTETKNNENDDPLFGDGANDESAVAGSAGAEQRPRLMPEDYIRQADADFIKAMREGRYPEIVNGIADLNYSLRNVMLIKSQMPEATKVMGMHAWNYQGRSIVGGQKSLKILAVTDKSEEAAEDGAENSGNTNGKNYRMSYVFDVSQTKGKALKDKACTPEVLDRYFDGIKKTITGLAQGYTFVENDKNGVNFDEKVVSIQKGLSREEQLKAIIYAAARVRAEGKQREEGEEISQGRGLFNAIEETAVTHIAARRLRLGDYPLKTADFEMFDDDGLMKLSTNLHFIKMGAQRITNAVERYISEAQSVDALKAAREAVAAQPAVTQIPGYYPIFNGNVPTVVKSEAEAGG